MKNPCTNGERVLGSGFRARVAIAVVALSVPFALGIHPPFSSLVPSVLTSAVILASSGDFESMAKRLANSGINAASGRSIQGKSGVNHEFAFSICTPSGKPKVVVDTSLSVNEVDETNVLAFYVKVFDTGPERAVLAVSPRLSERARSLAKEYRIMVLENEAPRKLVGMVQDTVRKALEEPWKL